MKKSIVLILSAVMLFAAIPLRSQAAPTACPLCGNPDLYETLTEWESLNGYSHPYTTRDGKPAGCTVYIMKEYYFRCCS